jgi:hypothetical protein
MKTSFEDKCLILGQLWVEFKDEEEWEDFCDKNDMGLPLAFMLDMGLVENPSPLAFSFIEQTFSLLLAHARVEDLGWKSLEDILDSSEGEK